MATKKKLLEAAAGSAGGAAALNVEQVFSTYLYDGNSATQNIQNDILLGDGPEEGTVLQLTCDDLSDHSPVAKTITNVGVSVNTSTKKYGTGSLYFGGSNVLRASDGTLAFNSYDFTVEFWIYLPNASSLAGILRFWDGSNQDNYSSGLYINNGYLTWNIKTGTNGSLKSVAAGSPIGNSTWAHIALTRHQNEFAMYINGTKQADVKDASGFDLIMKNFELGTHYGTLGETTYCFTGYVDDLRITSGSSRYTANFTAPTAALPLDTLLTGEGGLVWHKVRSTVFGSRLVDSENGNFYLQSASTSNLTAIGSPAYTLNSNGFTVPNGATAWNESGQTYASWTFRKAPKFFDCVTWTGDGTGARTISHYLNTSNIGSIIIKKTSGVEDWYVMHRSATNGLTSYGLLNQTSGFLALVVASQMLLQQLLI